MPAPGQTANHCLMKDIILALLGGGAAVQLANTLATLRPSRRKMDADSLGVEVGALERTIGVLQKNFELENSRHRQEVEILRAEISSLRAEVASLRAEADMLRSAQNSAAM